MTIDRDLQEAAWQAMGDHDGSVVALDPNTGEILALVNRPSYDPNVFARGIRRGEWRDMVTDKRHPLNNRAIQDSILRGLRSRSSWPPLPLRRALSNHSPASTVPAACSSATTTSAAGAKRDTGRSPARRARTVLRRVLLPGGAAARDRHDCPLRPISRPGRTDGNRPGTRETRHDPDTAWKRRPLQPAVYAGETLSVESDRDTSPPHATDGKRDQHGSGGQTLSGPSTSRISLHRTAPSSAPERRNLPPRSKCVTPP